MLIVQSRKWKSINGNVNRKQLEILLAEHVKNAMEVQIETDLDIEDVKGIRQRNHVVSTNMRLDLKNPLIAIGNLLDLP